MNTIAKYSLLILFFSTLAACGNSDDNGNNNGPGATQATPISTHSSTLQNQLLDWDGTELAAGPIDLGVLSANITLLGGVFCQPSNLYSQPQTPSIPPTTVYGCANSVNLTYDIAADNTSVTFTLTVPSFYVDFDGNFTVAKISSHVQGYGLATNLVISAEVEILGDDSGNRYFGTIINSSIAADSTTVMVNDEIVQAVLPDQLISDDALQVMLDTFESLVTGFTTNGNPISLN